MRFLLSMLALCSTLTSPATAELSPDNRQQLATALGSLSLGPNNAAAQRAGEVLDDPEHGAADYDEFFVEFLSQESLSLPLARFLGDRALHHSSPAARRALQNALSRAAVSQIEEVLRSELPDRLGPELTARPRRLEHLRSAMELLGRLAFEGKDLSAASRRQNYERLRDLIASHPGVLRKEFSIDVVAQPKLAAIRAQLYKNLQDLQAPFDPTRFCTDTGFRGPYAELARKHGVLVLDNNGLDERQLRAIDELLSAIPSNLHRTLHISVHESLGNSVEHRVEIPLAGSPGVNIFSFSIGLHVGNDFPSDVSSIPVQGFCAVLQHELNHMVDARTVSGDPARSRRRDELIARAGSNSMQYLRSMFDSGFFVRHPQEFFASIANQYFSNSFHALYLALQRFDEGWREPINQFLFFADVYSQGGDSTMFVVQDAECEYRFYTVGVGRDSRGHINRLLLPGSTLRFDLDEAGNVVR